HYLELPFDLSEVMFLCTANTLETLSAPLRDRLEIVELTGYTPDEKAHITKQHLIPKQMKEHAIREGQFSITNEALPVIVRDYTREAGVRQLEREIRKLCRGATLNVAKSPEDSGPIVIKETDLIARLGKPKFKNKLTKH